MTRVGYRLLPALFASGLLVGCAQANSDPTPGVRVVGGTGWHAILGISHVPAQADWLIRGVMLCVDGRGKAKLEDVVFNDSAVKVTGFALQDNPAWKDGSTYGKPMATDHAGTLEKNGFDPKVKTVTHRCDSESEDEAKTTGKGHELLLQVRSPGSGVGRFDGFDVLYSGHRRVHVPLEIVLCPGDASTEANCQPNG